MIKTTCHRNLSITEQAQYENLLTHRFELSPSEKKTEKLTGGSSSYYMVKVENPTTLDEDYWAECNDIIEALKMTYAEANVFKATWRSAAARLGNGKPGTSALYDAEKVVFFGKRMIATITGKK